MQHAVASESDGIWKRKHQGKERNKLQKKYGEHHPDGTYFYLCDKDGNILPGWKLIVDNPHKTYLEVAARAKKS